jgi:hypothetical protein
VALVSVCLASLSCISLYEAAHPLTEEARKVQIAPSGQAMSVELADQCTRVGRIQPVMSAHFAKLRADQLHANVAQVLTVSQVNGRPHRLEVRFFRCPRELSQLDSDR